MMPERVTPVKRADELRPGDKIAGRTIVFASPNYLRRGKTEVRFDDGTTEFFNNDAPMLDEEDRKCRPATKDYNQQIKLLIADLNTACDAKDYEAGLFYMWQIFELSKKYNKGRTPNPEVVKLVEQGNNIEMLQMLNEAIERRGFK